MKRITVITSLAVLSAVATTTAMAGNRSDPPRAMAQHMRLMAAENPGMGRMMELMRAGNPGMAAMMDAPPMTMTP